MIEKFQTKSGKVIEGKLNETIKPIVICTGCGNQVIGYAGFSLKTAAPEFMAKCNCGKTIVYPYNEFILRGDFIKVASPEVEASGLKIVQGNPEKEDKPKDVGLRVIKGGKSD